MRIKCVRAPVRTVRSVLKSDIAKFLKADAQHLSKAEIGHSYVCRLEGCLAVHLPHEICEMPA